MDILGLFAKQPISGHVKTRLAADIGQQSAAEIYELFVNVLIDRFRQIGQQRFLCHSPNNADAANFFREQTRSDYQIWGQPELPFGERLASFFDHAFSQGAEHVVVIGSDSPTLPATLVEEAFQQLENHDVVLGPATDGGYYLIGQSSATFSDRNGAAIFDDINWSESHVLEQTIHQIAGCGATLALLPPWYDVDSFDDLQSLRGHLSAMWYADHQRPRTYAEQLLFDKITSAPFRKTKASPENGA